MCMVVWKLLRSMLMRKAHEGHATTVCMLTYMYVSKAGSGRTLHCLWHTPARLQS